MTQAVSSKMPQDLIEEIEAATEDGESKSAAVRRLVRAGLDAEESPDGVVLTYPALVSMVGWIFVAAAFMDVSDTLGYAGLAIVAFGLLHTFVSRFTDIEGF